MSDKNDMDNQAKVTRRDFLKIAAVTTGGVIATVAMADSVYAESDINVSLMRDGTEAQEFTDSAERKTSIPKEIKTVIPAGIIAQTLLITLCSEKISTLAKEIEDDEEAQYTSIGKGKLNNLEETGNLYSRHGRDIKTAKITAESPSLVIDAGEEKSDIDFSLDYLQARTNVPTVFVDATFGMLPKAYRTLGALLGCERRAEQLAVYIEDIYKDVTQKCSLVSTSPAILYAANENGLWQRSERTVQDDVIEFLGGVSVKSPIGATPDTMNAEVLSNQQFNCVIFNNRECVEQIFLGTGKAYELWASVPAILNGMYTISPALYHYWFGSSMLFTQTIGMQWLGKTIWPDIYDYDLVSEAKKFYSLFYDRTLDEEMLNRMGLL